MSIQIAKNWDLQYTQYGKPTREMAAWAEKTLSPAQKIYMIGDNPAADLIPGPLWNPILVRSGVFKGTSHERAKAVCEDVEEAVRLILKKEAAM